MSQRPRDHCTSLRTDIVVRQAAMYTPTHTAATTQSSPNPPHAMNIQTIYTSPHTPTQSSLQTYTSLPMPNRSLAPCLMRIQNIPRAFHCIPNTRSHFTSAKQTRLQKHTCGPALPTITASPHTARRLMARSLTHYVLQLSQQWHMSQRNRDRCTAKPSKLGVVMPICV
jgi:hypothetical protein